MPPRADKNSSSILQEALPTSTAAEVSVFIPTFARGALIIETLKKIAECEPRPEEILVHIDQTDGKLEAVIAEQFPDVRVFGSQIRLGPGGGRDFCLKRARTPLAVSFDDDSWPVDRDFFAKVVDLFAKHPEAALIGATIWHRCQQELPRDRALLCAPAFTGCGYAIRVDVYRELAGFLPRPVAYGLEESDLALQLFADGYRIFESRELRVFHDTELRHHDSSEITECVVANVALLAFVRYPAWLWGWGLLQLASTVKFCLAKGRWRGVPAGLGRIPKDCWSFRQRRRPLSGARVWAYLQWRRRSEKRAN